MAVDPVCHMDVEESSAPAKAEYAGKTYYFCRPECRDEFLQHPDRYLSRAS